MRSFPTLLLLLLATLQLPAQTGGKDGHRLLGSNAEGTRFMIAFMQNEIDNSWCRSPEYGQRLVMVASRFDATIQVELPNGQRWGRKLKPLEVYTFEVERRLEMRGEQVMDAGIEITSDRPVSVYCYNGLPTTSDGYLAIPVSAWGREYVSVNYGVDHYDDPGGGFDPFCFLYPRGGELAVIAAEDGTLVSVYPSTMSLLGSPAGVPITKSLRKGEVFQVQDGGSQKGRSDLTGSIVIADRPVGVLTGHVRAGVPVIYSSKDHLIEMLPPRNALGKRYFAIPFRGREGGDVLRIVNTTNGNITVSFEPVGLPKTVATLDAVGAWVDFQLEQPTVVTATEPILAAQYSKSAAADPRNLGRIDGPIKFDPYMILLTPEEQFVNAAVFQTMSNYSTSLAYRGQNPADPKRQYDHHYITLVGERANFSAIRLNGLPISTQPGYSPGLIPATNYAYATIEVADSSIHYLEGDALFGGYVYGIGDVDSYGWPIGAGLRQFDLKDINAPILSARPGCDGTEIVVRESGPLEVGLRAVWLDSTASTNVEFERVTVIRGDEISVGMLRLVGTSTSGHGRIIAEDLDGNRDTLEIDLEPYILTVDPASILLRPVLPGQVYDRTITITNPTGQGIRIDSIRLARRTQGFFFRQQINKDSLPAGSSRDITVSFGSDREETLVDTVVIYWECGILRIPLTAIVNAPSIATHPLDFGKVRVGRTRCLDLKVSSTGEADLMIDSITIEGITYTMSSLPDLPLLLPAGRDTIIRVCFAPDATGPSEGRIRFFSNADSVAVAELTGIGIYPVLSTAGFDFGRLQLGDTGCTVIPVTNLGDDTATVTGLTLFDPRAFLVDSSSFPRALGNGDTLWVRVCFVPDSAGPFLTDFFVRNSDGLEAGERLQGSGYELRASIDGYDWGPRWVGTRHGAVVHVRNRGNEPITITRVWISDGDVGDFNAMPTGLPTLLEPGDSLPVPVEFTPLVAGDRATFIRAATSSRLTPEVSNTLVGFGLVALASDELRFDSSVAYACEERNGMLTIFNEGNSPLTLEEVVATSTPPVLRLQGSHQGETILPGDSVVVNFVLPLDGESGGVDGMVRWRFAELADTFRRAVVLPGALPQTIELLAEAPANVAVAGGFDVAVKVSSLRFADVLDSSLTLVIAHNARVSRFDFGRWRELAAAPPGAWRPDGDPVILTTGEIVVRYVATPAATLEGVAFLPLPFRAYLGDARYDTVSVALLPANERCALPARVSVSYAVDSICGLSQRLFEVTDSPYALRQNHPNPGGRGTTIEFSLGLEAPTRLEIVDANGLLVAMPVDRVMSAGAHAVELDLGSIPSGTYYYRLTSGPFSAVRRMVVER